MQTELSPRSLASRRRFLKRRLEQRRPDALKDHRPLLRKAVVMGRSSGPPGNGSLVIPSASALSGVNARVAAPASSLQMTHFMYVGTGR